MTDRESVAEAVNELVSTFDNDDSVAFAEVGGVHREMSEVVVSESGVRNAVEHVTTGVWCRPFADGAAAYRFTTDLSSEGLEKTASRAVTAAEQLAQSTPAQIDAASTYRGTHDGWANESVTQRDIDSKRDAIQSAVSAVDTTLDRLRLNYSDARAEVSVANTADSVVQTAIDRAEVDVTLVTTDGSKLRRHLGTTRGAALLDRLSDALRSVDRDAQQLTRATNDTVSDGDLTVVLSPEAAGQLFHQLAGYLAADIVASGLSPFEIGDRLTDASLTIDDIIEPGSWGAMAYDAEGRPTTPVRLVDGGRIESYLYDTATAAAADKTPVGTTVPALGFEQAPRIHHRNLRVHPGSDTLDELLANTDIYVRRFHPARYRDEFERTQRNGTMPASTPYAHDVASRVPDAVTPARINLPVAEGFCVESGELNTSVTPTLSWTPEAMATIHGIGRTCQQITGVASKHKSRIPYAVTAPAIRLDMALV